MGGVGAGGLTFWWSRAGRGVTHGHGVRHTRLAFAEFGEGHLTRRSRTLAQANAKRPGAQVLSRYPALWRRGRDIDPPARRASRCVWLAHHFRSQFGRIRPCPVPSPRAATLSRLQRHSPLSVLRGAGAFACKAADQAAGFNGQACPLWLQLRCSVGHMEGASPGRRAFMGSDRSFHAENRSVFGPCAPLTIPQSLEFGLALRVGRGQIAGRIPDFNLFEMTYIISVDI